MDLIDRLVADWQRERPGTAADAMQVVGRIIRLGRLYENMVAEMLSDHRLSYSDFDVVATLRRSGKPYELAPTELRRSVLLTSGAMTACLRRLELNGMISREASPHDRRRLSAKLTPQGFDLVEKLIDRRFEVAENALAGLSAEETAVAEQLLRKLGAPRGSGVRPTN